jgi:thiol-disulfide isomerase/thioredoxin
MELNDNSHLTKQNMKKLETSLNGNNVIILLHAKWCGWCQQFRPEWNKFVNQHKNNENLLVVEVESDQLERLNKSVRDKLVKNENIGFPTIFLFKNGSKYKYEGERTSSALANHLKDIIPAMKKRTVKPVVPKKTKSAQKGGEIDVGHRLEASLLNVIKDFFNQKHKTRKLI